MNTAAAMDYQKKYQLKMIKQVIKKKVTCQNILGECHKQHTMHESLLTKRLVIMIIKVILMAEV